MLAKARAKLFASKEVKAIDLALGNGQRLPFHDNTFDCANIGFALQNVADINGIFQEMARVVKWGMRLISLEVIRPILPWHLS